MANYKKITDVEVMEQVGENSMALVEDNGTLKKVPCTGFGGGSSNILIAYDYEASKIECETTYNEFVTMFKAGMLPAIICNTRIYAGETIRQYYCSDIHYTGATYDLSFYCPVGSGKWLKLVWDTSSLHVDNSPA